MDDTAEDFIRNTQNAIAEFDAGKLLDQRKDWAKTRACRPEEMGEKPGGALETNERRALDALKGAQRKSRRARK